MLPWEMHLGAPLCHFEFMSDDPDKSRAFYAEVLGWEYSETPMPGYTLISTGKDPAGGVMKRPPEVPSVALNVYFQVEDIDATLEKVVAAGGQVFMPKKPIPNVGAFAFFTDPEGIPIGIFQQM